MKRFTRVLLAVFVVASLSACATYRQAYRDDLTERPELEEANTSYKKALHWIKEGDTVKSPGKAIEFYATAESYLTDAMFKLKELGYEHKIDVSDELAYCENVQRETHTKKGQAEKKMKNAIF